MLAQSFARQHHNGAQTGQRLRFYSALRPHHRRGGMKSASNESLCAHDGVQLQGRTGLASLDGDTVRLRDGHLLLNDQDYGVVASDATVRYRRTAAGKELSVNGKVIATLR